MFLPSGFVRLSARLPGFIALVRTLFFGLLVLVHVPCFLAHAVCFWFVPLLLLQLVGLPLMTTENIYVRFTGKNYGAWEFQFKMKLRPEYEVVLAALLN